jgi:hypothetical protein
MSTDGQLTFTRSNDTATRVASNGLIEKVRTNLFTYSEQFDNAAWTKVDTTIVANAVVNPLNGAVTADKITDSSTATTARYFFQSPASSGTIYTSSGYFKKAEYNFVTLHAFGLNGALFNLDTGVKVSQSGGVGNITSVGDGWYRCTFSFTAGGSSVFFSQSPAGNISYAGTTGSGIYAFGCQLETGDIATDYIPTTTAAVSVGPVANVPRLDYLGSSCPRLLLEPQRTNLVTFSENIDNAAYSKLNTTVTSNATTSPTGYQDADKIIANTTNGVHNVSQSFSIGSSTAYTASIYAKKGEYSGLRINFTSSANTFVSVNLNTGVIQSSGGSIYLSSSITSVGNDWYRITMSFLPPIVSSSLNFIIENPVGTVSFAGDNTSGIFLWGAQLEVGSYPTSYIPTLAASVTRGADACSKTGVSSLIGQTQGTLFMDVNLTSRSSFSYFAIAPNIGSSTTYIGIGITATAFSFEVVNSGTQMAYNFPSTATGSFKLALAYKANDFVAYVNGALVHTDTSGTVPACSELGLNAYSNTAALNYNQALLFTTRLTNAQMQELTSL